MIDIISPGNQIVEFCVTSFNRIDYAYITT